MNEKIKQIAVEAKLEHCVSHVRLQEFAELIIKQCAEQVKNVHKQGGGTYGEMIKKHFGIKI
jgi:hypothetical protein